MSEDILKDSWVPEGPISKTIKDSGLPKEIRIGAIVRGKDIIIPKTDFKFEMLLHI